MEITWLLIISIVRVAWLIFANVQLVEQLQRARIVLRMVLKFVLDV